jgi:glutathione synthase/RimK-type ligase-like ATP-grasp enzyme
MMGEKKMRLLKITANEHPELDELFEDVEHKGVEELAPEVMDGKSNVRMNGEQIDEYDAAFLELPTKNPVFGRVLLEMIEEKGVKTNYPAIAFHIMAKKNYLAYVLEQKNINTPKKVVVASEKACRNVQKELELPIIARKYEDHTLNEQKLLEEQQEIEEFAEGTEYTEDVIIFEEYNEGDKYRLLCIGEDMVSLKDKSDGWRISEESLHYSNVSKEIREEVRKTVDSIGTPFAEVLVRGKQVVDVNPNPDLKTFTDISGKNAYESLAQVLKQED